MTMTRNKAVDASIYSFNDGEYILLDANIWLSLYSPPSSSTRRRAAQYSSVFQRLIAAKAKPVVDAVILSEFINRYSRIEFDAAKRSVAGTPQDFKQYRRTPAGLSAMQAAVAEARRILAISSPHDTPFSRITISDVLAETAAGTLDFNDGVLVESCRLNGWKLLTDDGDMQLGGVEVLTANRTLLQACT
jgi:predicted nucleic acid-binding protein